MKYLMSAVLSGAVLSAPVFAEGTREADAHEHGHGTFNMAIEGNVVAIELETPSFDLLGFEHEANSDLEKAVVETAREALADPIALFGLPKDAGCRVSEAEIEIGADETHHDDHDDEHHDDDKDHDDHAEKDDHDDEHHDDDKDHDDHGDHDDHAEGEGESEHSEVHAHYELTCDAPDQVNAVNMTQYFNSFPNAEELDAAILTDAGQASGELEPDSPELSF